MANKKVTPGSLTDAYKKRKGDFSPDLVGFQLTKGTPLFTLGNFGVTTNLDPKSDTFFNTGVYSNTYTLDNLNLDEQESELLVSNNIYTTLNLDPTDVTKFVYYGSFVEYLRVNIEGVITKWKGSLYITDDEGGFSRTAKNTVLGYSYNSLTDESTIKIPTLFVENKFDLITNDLGGIILDTRDISNIKLSYRSYEIKNDYGTFELLGYSGDTEGVNPYIDVVVKGEAFPTLTATTFGTFKYHLKPKDLIVDRLFFDTLTDFENILLNRLTLPKYTSTFESPLESESGTLLSVRKTFTWPTTDGFNIDVDTVEYTQYLSSILKMATDYDRLRGNLITRRFISNSIIEFDTEGDGSQDQGRKVDKLLKIYGREFDEVKKYVDSIKYAHNVTYDKKDNIPDELIKSMAKTLGFEAIKSVSDNKLISYIAKSNEVIFSGHSRSMSTKEIDTELWRRLVINAWWLFKSKGHRKVVEFFVKLFGLNECLVNIDECVYVVKDKLDVEETFDKIEEILYPDLPEDERPPIDRSEYPIDEEGFPRTLPNRQDYYFQMHGFWYNNGTQRTVGNNPHFGPYDYGSAYFDKFRCFIDDFSGKTEVITQEYIENVNLFPDYNHGDLEITFEDGKPLQDYGTEYAQTMEDNDRVNDTTDLLLAGFSTEKSRTGRGSLKITFTTCSDDACDIPCPNFQIEPRTGVVIELGNGALTQECCEFHGFEYVPTTFPELYTQGLTGPALEMYQNYLEQMTNIYGDQVFNNNPRGCFWCKPALPICDFRGYISSIVRSEGIDGIIQILLEEGLITEEQIPKFIEQWTADPTGTAIKMIEYFNRLYDGYCLVVHTGFEQVSEKCCRVRGGEWTNINANKVVNSEGKKVKGDVAVVANAPKEIWRCVIPKEVPPPIDPCLCELPDYCDFKLRFEFNMNGLNWLECPDINTEIAGYTPQMFEQYQKWAAERNKYFQAQYTAVLQGLPAGSTIPYTPIPKPIPGLEAWTGYDTWSVVNITNGCYDEYYGWVSDGGVDTNGNPTGQATAPCLSDDCNGVPDGTVIGTDYEIYVAAPNRAKRDAAAKAKNELMLAMGPYIMTNESLPLYYLDKCGYGCGKDCNCEESTYTCPDRVAQTYITCEEYVKKMGGTDQNGIPYDCNCTAWNGFGDPIKCLGGSNTFVELTDGFGNPIIDEDCCKISAERLKLNPNDYSVYNHKGVGCFGRLTVRVY